MLYISHTFVQVNFCGQRNTSNSQVYSPYTNYMSLLNTIMALSYYYNSIAWRQGIKKERDYNLLYYYVIELSAA